LERGARQHAETLSRRHAWRPIRRHAVFAFSTALGDADSGRKRENFLCSGLRRTALAARFLPARVLETRGFADHGFSFPFKSKSGRTAALRLFGFLLFLSPS